MLSLEAKIGQMVMVGFLGLEPPDYLLEWLASGRIGGVILFGRNVAGPAQLAALTEACHRAASSPLLIGIDQEGGVVARLREDQGFTESPGAMALGAAGSPTLAEEVSAALGAELRALGINWNLAPVLDLTVDINNPSVGTRSPGADPHQVAALAAAQVRGLQRAGVAATAKHFPGIGRTPVDSHLALPIIEEPPDSLRERDFAPYRAAAQAGVASVMVGHVQFTAVDPRHPATLSPRVIQDLLRREIGFQGLVCTDCMEMRAVSNHYGPGESAVLAALAGADAILFSHSFFETEEPHREAYEALLGAARSGRLPLAHIDAAVGRIRQVKERFAITEPPAPEQVRQPERLALMERAARAGTILLRAEPEAFPLPPTAGARAALVEFASYRDSEAMDQGGSTTLAALLRRQAPQVETASLKAMAPSPGSLARARELAAGADVLILAARNAHLNDAELAVARELLALGRRAILLCLKNPYDAELLPGAGTVLCTCGDSMPSLRAAVDALLGRFAPAGSLPVPLRMTK